MKIIHAAIAAATLVPAVSAADTEVYVTPPAERTVLVEDPMNAPVFASGALVFAASYGTSLVFAARAESNEPNHHLFVPIVGPWLALADRPDCNVRLTGCDDETLAKVFLVMDGVFQAGGVIAMVNGLVSPTYHREVVRVADTKKVKLAPTTVGMFNSPGLGISGRF
ncbi:MAG: hypothetical protein KF773_39895 [Deltaproteobacteria bacterium]|nr:hypothetical protein [Deltaproteobacteria bacterium]MCW5803760.1 hypothetical protein [Deltaproteobacteria bacterium]